MGRDTKAELQKCLRHNTAMHAKIEAQDIEIERLRGRIKLMIVSAEEADRQIACIFAKLPTKEPG